MSATEAGTSRHADRRVTHVSGLGCVTAALFFTFSLTPSLMPRDALTQGVLAGVVAVIGYELTMIAQRLCRYLELPLPETSNRAPRLVLFAVAAAVVAYGLWTAERWQNEIRRVVELPPVESGQRLTIAAIAVAAFLFLWLLLRIIGLLADRLSALARGIVPPRIAAVVGIAAALWLVWAVIDGTLMRTMLAAADEVFEARDLLVDPERPAPTDPSKTGSAQSLLAWSELGRWGRDYIARAPSAAEIAEFQGDRAMDPIRVYVGRRSADTAEERAELALRELIRQGAFDRSALVVMTPVGTGWMDPGGQDTLDFVMAGDVATVAVQYSYLTSVLSLLVHPEYGVEQGRVLFDRVYDHWTSLPPEARPRLFLHGLSQGALNSQLSVEIFDLLADPIDGALWVGSPFMSPYWERVRDNGALGGLPVAPGLRQRLADPDDGPGGRVGRSVRGLGADPASPVAVSQRRHRAFHLRFRVPSAGVA